ncbi:DUF5937 family protein [Pseudonocardia sp. CA-107938]|uniref:ArsR/SmtB family transcription factor n=1 Tax=Pseudonocardia sp. CA-107938 TaxID=3240021 RepID=UPI003D9235A4
MPPHGSQTVRFEFGHEDLLRTRFAISPLTELVAATYVLRQPQRFPEHRPWVETAAAQITDLRVDLLFAVYPLGRAHWPHFTTPAPTRPRPAIEDELARVAANDAAVVRADVHRAFPDGPPAELRPLLDDPRTALPELVDQMSAFWDAALQPSWNRITGFLESEIVARAHRLVADGGTAAFDGLADTVGWDGRTLTVSRVRTASQVVPLNGRGLLLIPSVLAFGAWPCIAGPSDPALTYQPPGTADLWLHDTGTTDDLDHLLGRRRAALLRHLDQPASTATLARRTGWSPGGINTHLSVLRRNGLVVRRRCGREVLYTRTPTGNALTRP